MVCQNRGEHRRVQVMQGFVFCKAAFACKARRHTAACIQVSHVLLHALSTQGKRVVKGERSNLSHLGSEV